MEDLNLSWVLKSDGNADLFKLDKDNLVNFPVWKQKLFIQSFVETNLAATACVLLLPKNFIWMLTFMQVTKFSERTLEILPGSKLFSIKLKWKIQ